MLEEYQTTTEPYQIEGYEDMLHITLKNSKNRN